MSEESLLAAATIPGCLLSPMAPMSVTVVTGGGGLIPHDERKVERMQSKDVKNMNVSDESVLLMAQNGSAAKMDTPIVALS